MSAKLTTESCIVKANLIHNNKYDYSKAVYTGDKSKVCIICPIHGEFMQTFGMHIRQKQGCKKCGIQNNLEKQRKKTILKLQSKCKDVNAIIYLDTYKHAHANVECFCKKHNKKYKTLATNIGILNRLCPACQKEHINIDLLNKRKERFLKNAKLKHNNKYTYNLSNFYNGKSYVEIVCPTHGVFKQKAHIHVDGAGSGCQTCSSSRGEERIKYFLDNNNINYTFQYSITINNSKHYYDFYVPSKNYIIEFNGLQHYKPILYFGGQKAFKYTITRDKIKINYCKEKQINLLIISYYDIQNIDTILEHVLVNNKALTTCNKHTRQFLNKCK